MKQKINVEWLVTENCNFSCSYCGLYNNKKSSEKDKDKLKKFLKTIYLKQQVYDFDFFLFGGEPFLHPDIDFIINEMNQLKIDYTIQSNCSYYSVDKISKLQSNIKAINFSIHLREFSCKQSVMKNIDQMISLNINIKNIEVMYVDKYDLELYYELVYLFPDLNIILCPISDFLVTGFRQSLREYNQLMINDKNINFEKVSILHPITKILTPRSHIWEEFANQTLSPKNKECILKDKFIMYDSKLEVYNCCFHDNIKDNICTYDSCFLS